MRRRRRRGRPRLGAVAATGRHRPRAASASPVSCSSSFFRARAPTASRLESGDALPAPPPHPHRRAAHGLDEFLLGHERVRGLRPFVDRVLFWRDLSTPARGAPAARAREPRADLRQVRPDAVDAARPAAARHRRRAREAAGPRAAVPDRRRSIATLTRAATAGRSTRCSRAFDRDADRERVGRAGALRASCPTARRVAVKVLRPGIERRDRERPRAACDTARDAGRAAVVGRQAPAAARRSSPSSRRRSATSSTSRARRRTARSCAATSCTRRCCSCPRCYWDYTTPEVLVMERMAGIPIGRIDELRDAGIDLKRLARAGVEIFFTQVFRDGFFHADMHPGNIFVAVDPAQPRQVHRARLRHHRHAVREGQELSRAELPRVLPPRLPPRRDRAHRVGLGAAGHARRRARGRDPRRAASRSSTGR